jgi:hypothetical protein
MAILERGQNDLSRSKLWDSSVIAAADRLVQLDIAVLNAEVANGKYKDLNAAAQKVTYPPLPEASRESVAGAYQKWGILPPGSLVESITVHATRITPGEALPG